MFKRFLPALSSSSTNQNQGETLFDLEANSGDSSSKHSDCSSEQITKSDIPTLRRRHSFVTPYAESVLEEEINRTNGNADLSIDPFDSSNTLKRSKSLSFNISRRPSFSTLRKKVPKSVRFESQEEFSERYKENSNPDIASTLFGTPESFQKDNSSTEKAFSSLESDLGETNKIQNLLECNEIKFLKPQENKIQQRYALFSEDCIISEQEAENSLGNQKNALKDNFLPLETTITYDQTSMEEYEESENDNSCLFTEYSQEDRNHENYIEAHQKKNKSSERSMEQEEGESIDEDQMMIIIMENLMKIVNHEPENINSRTSLHNMLDYSEKVLETSKSKDIEITQLKNQLRKKDDENFEKINILQEACTRLQSESNNCKIDNEQISKKYELLLCINDELERNEKNLRNDVVQLEADLSSSVSRLQIEIGSREDLLSLIDKYDSSEELSDNADALKGYIEQLFLKNESLTKENNALLEQQLKMKNRMLSLEESLQSTLDCEKEALQLVVEENKILDNRLKELESRLNGSDLITQNKLDEQNKLLNERNIQISEFKSQAIVLTEEKEYLKTKLSEYLADIEEANKQIQEELEFRNQMEKDYNKLNMKLKETESLLHKKAKIANDQLILKQSEFSKLNDIYSKKKQENIILLEELKKIKEERKNLTVENQKLTKDITECKLNLYWLQEHIKKSNKTVDIMSKEYIMVLKSNEIVSNTLKRFTMTIFHSMEPVMYEESRAYFENIYCGLEKQTLFSQGKISTVDSIIEFIARCISDVVSQYLENESLLQSEVENRNNNYQKMLDKLTKIMEDSIEKSHNSKENMNDIGETRRLQHKHKVGSENHRRGILQESKSVNFIS